uniref:Uncharacterized protein n=1 Tax=Rhizophora mucronata TaxID=61149 RepID=A0A2P2PM91_RHIMU
MQLQALMCWTFILN